MSLCQDSGANKEKHMHYLSVISCNNPTLAGEGLVVGLINSVDC